MPFETTVLSEHNSFFSGFNIVVNIIYNITDLCSVQSLKAGTHILPHPVAGKEFSHLPARFLAFYKFPHNK